MWAVNLPYMLVSVDMPAEQRNSIHTGSLEGCSRQQPDKPL